MTNILSVGLFGVLGVFSRWAIDAAAGRWLEISPIGILVINIVGSFIAGIVYVLGTERSLIPPHLSTGLLVGFCGGFTTFSAYSVQTALYIQKADLCRGIGYLCISPLLGLLGALLGMHAAKALS